MHQHLSLPVLGLVLTAASWSFAGALDPLPSVPSSVCTPATSAGPVSVASVCADVPPMPSAMAAAREAIASTHDHDDRYYTEQESNGRFLGIAAKAADSELLDGRDSASFADAVHDHDARYYTQEQSDSRYAPAVHAHSSFAQGWAAENTGFLRPGDQWVEIPGLRIGFNLLRPALVHLQAQGMQRVLSGTCHVEYRYVVDGMPRGDEHGQGIQTANDAIFQQHWTLIKAERLDAGDHVVSIEAKPLGNCLVCAEVDFGGTVARHEACNLNVAAFYG